MGFPTFCLRFFLLKVREISNKHRQNEPWEQMQQVRGQAIPLFCKSIPEVAAQAQTGGFWNGNVAVGCTLTRQVGVNVVELKGRAISLSRPLCILAYLGRVHGLAAYAWVFHGCALLCWGRSLVLTIKLYQKQLHRMYTENKYLCE